MLWQIGLFTSDGTKGYDPTTIGLPQIYELILRLGQILTYLIGAVILVYILMAALQYITAAGNDSKQAEAKKTITSAIVGFIIVLFAFTFINTLLRRIQFDATIIKGNVQTESGGNAGNQIDALPNSSSE
ncbi:MAG TPA: pilin [Patescibacteria group bacterium]